MKSTQAQVASLIRKELKQAFPTITFKIKSSSFAGGNSVDITWENGPTRDEVDTIVSKYEYSSFDPMHDFCEITNHRDDIPQVKFVQTQRYLSDDLMNALWEHLRKIRGEWENLSHMNEGYNSGGYICYPCAEIYRMICNKNLTNLTLEDIINEERNKTA